MKKLLVLFCVLVSFNSFAEYCEGTPVSRGARFFCYPSLNEGYASLDEVKMKYGEGPVLPGYPKGLISQLHEAMDVILDKDHEKAVEILSEVYAQNEYLISIDDKWSKRRLLKKARPYLQDAIFHLKTFWPRKGKLKNLINSAVRQIERYTLKRR